MSRQAVVEKSFKNPSYMARLRQDMKKNWSLYLLVVPVLLFYIIFNYGPIYGLIIAFKDYVPAKGILGSSWVGFKHFEAFFGSTYFLEILRNTLVISFSTLLFGFPAPIILALLINEVKSTKYKKAVQTVTYLPHFISLVVICGMIKTFVSDTGIITNFLMLFGFDKVDLLGIPKYFTSIYVVSGIWQEVGWNSIIYLAALAGVDQELYEAARIDGAGRWRQTLSVTLPSIAPTIVVLFILRVGNIMSVGYEKIILLYNPLIYSTADVVTSFAYRRGLIDMAYSYSAAVGFFNSVINMTLVILANTISKKVNDTSIY